MISGGSPSAQLGKEQFRASTSRLGRLDRLRLRHEPSKLAIYADHDEYTTFYGRDRAALEALTSALKEAGYEHVPDYGVLVGA